MFKTILFCSLLLNAFSSVIEVNRENLTLENSFYFYAESEEDLMISILISYTTKTFEISKISFLWGFGV